MRPRKTGVLRHAAAILALATVGSVPGLSMPDHAAPASAAASHDNSVVEIKAVIAKYAEAVNREPVDLDLASSVWADSPDDTLIFPLGEIRGWDHIQQDFYQGIMEGAFSQRTLTPAGIQVHAYGDCGWAEFTWRFVAKSRKDGSSVVTNGRETQIYQKLGPHHWVLVHVHYSSLSAAELSSPPRQQ